jgi:hypothetical protein
MIQEEEETTALAQSKLFLSCLLQLVRKEQDK